jgi:hypothetical protein
MVYEDGKIACDETGLTIRQYYPWGAKRIPYSSNRPVKRSSLGNARKWRLWGSGDLVHWWNLDLDRPKQEIALDIDTGGRIRPTITPDDPGMVERILTERLARQGTSSK